MIGVSDWGRVRVSDIRYACECPKVNPDPRGVLLTPEVFSDPGGVLSRREKTASLVRPRAVIAT